MPNLYANNVAQGAVTYCADATGVPQSSTAVGDARTMMGRFWLEDRIGMGQLDSDIVQHSKDEGVHQDMVKLGACLTPLADQAGTGAYFRMGVQAYEGARQLAIKAENNPAVAAEARALGLLP